MLNVLFSCVGGRGGRGRGRGGPGRGRGRGKEGEKEWVPVTKLGRLVRDGKIRTLEEIYLFSLPIKASVTIMCYQSAIVNHFIFLGVRDH